MKIIRLFDMLGVFDITCDYCRGSKSGKYWSDDDYPGKKFCKKTCYNKYIWDGPKPPCKFCNKIHGTRVFKYQDEPFGSKECKEKFIIKTKFIELKDKLENKYGEQIVRNVIKIH